MFSYISNATKIIIIIMDSRALREAWAKLREMPAHLQACVFLENTSDHSKSTLYDIIILVSEGFSIQVKHCFDEESTNQETFFF